MHAAPAARVRAEEGGGAAAAAVALDDLARLEFVEGLPAQLGGEPAHAVQLLRVERRCRIGAVDAPEGRGRVGGLGQPPHDVGLWLRRQGRRRRLGRRGGSGVWRGRGGKLAMHSGRKDLKKFGSI